MVGHGHQDTGEGAGSVCTAKRSIRDLSCQLEGAGSPSGSRCHLHSEESWTNSWKGIYKHPLQFTVEKTKAQGLVVQFHTARK